METTEPFVGQKLVKKTYEECLKAGINPNPNPPGRFRDFSKDTPEFLKTFVEKDQEETINALKDTTYQAHSAETPRRENGWQ